MGSFIVLIIVIIILTWIITKYNGLVTLRNQVENGWKQIDIQLKRRHDLIPNLVNVVKGYFARQFYNDIAMKFNIAQVLFPSNIAKNIFLKVE
jgi:hypothetical protein